MVALDTSTPQLKVARNWIDAYVAIDIDKIDAIHSKNYKHQTSPKSIGLPEETRDEYTQRLRRMFPLFTKFEVRIQHRPELTG